jgi:hypothetical protein
LCAVSRGSARIKVVLNSFSELTAKVPPARQGPRDGCSRRLGMEQTPVGRASERVLPGFVALLAALALVSCGLFEAPVRAHLQCGGGSGIVAGARGETDALPA